MGWIVKVDDKGRIVIRREVRDKLALKTGDNLVAEVRDSEFVLQLPQPPERKQLDYDELRDFLSSKSI